MGRTARRRLSGSERTAVGVGALLLVAHLLHPEGAVGQLTYLSATGGAAVLAWCGVARLPRRERGPWRWIALGVTTSALGDVIHAYYVLVLEQSPDLSLADVGWLSSCVCLAVGLLWMLEGDRRGGRVDLDGVIDMVSVAVIGLLVVWQFSLKTTIEDTNIAGWTRVVWSAYPILDALLLALVFRGIASRTTRPWTSGVLAAGAACWLLSDFGYLVFSSAGAFSVWLDLGWMAGALLLAAATWYSAELARHPIPDTADAAVDRVGVWRVALPFVPLAVPISVELWSWSRGEALNPIPLAVARVILIGLAFARAMRLLRANERSQERLRTSEHYYRALAANSSDAVLVVDPSGRVINNSPAVLSILGYEPSSTVGADVLSIVRPEDQDHVRAVLEKSLQAPGKVFDAELGVRHAEGPLLWLAVRAVNLCDDPVVGGVVVNLHDITDRKRAEEELAHQALHDSLTGLPNRALFRDRVEHALRRRARTGTDPAVIYLDLDGFKTINDSFGHDVGDQLLRDVSARLVDSVRQGDTVARLGGDEFAVLIEPSSHAASEAADVADRLLEALRRPVMLGQQEVRASASAGIAIAEPDSSAATLLRNADIAMYRAKTGGKGRWVCYEEQMRAEALERTQLEADLGHAVEAGELQLVYQPVLELETDNIVGFEALLRWHHPILGVVGPDRFIPIAEANGLIIPIGKWVLDEACRTAARWRQQYPQDPPLSMAVNVSARQLASPNLVTHVVSALAGSGMDPADLVLEMTETALVEDPETATERLRELRNLGVRLAIDDFGTGYSSLSYLREFPVDILKIDRSFVKSIIEPGAVPPVLRAVLALCQTLGLETVAEGIESDIQRDSLREERCVLGQGFLFARPLGASEAETLLAMSHALTS